MALKNAPDLTKRPPRSVRVRLGGYVLLPRILDKCRAVVDGKNGEYKYACPTDDHFFTFTGIDPEAMKQQVAAGKSDSEMLDWVQKNAKQKRAPFEIAAWSTFMEQRVPSDPEGREFFQDEHKRVAPGREDIATWFDYLDLDDYVTFGGQP